MSPVSPLGNKSSGVQMEQAGDFAVAGLEKPKQGEPRGNESFITGETGDTGETGGKVDKGDTWLTVITVFRHDLTEIKSKMGEINNS